MAGKLQGAARAMKNTTAVLTDIEEVEQKPAKAAEKTGRLTVKLTVENHEFIKDMSKIMGMTDTDFLNLVIDRFREDEDSQQLMNSFKATKEKLKRKIVK